MIWLLITLMALITFSNRYILLSPRLRFTVGGRLQSLLKYTAPAVLTALWAPIVFTRDSRLALQYDNPYLIAGLITVVISLITRKPLFTVISGIVAFTLLSRY